MGLELEFTEGLQFDKGYISQYFITDQDRLEVVLDDAYVLVHQAKISSMADFLPLLEKVAQSKRPLLVIAEDVEGEALATIVVNKIRGAAEHRRRQGAGFGDRRKAMLADIATLTGATVVSDDLGIKLESVGPGEPGPRPPHRGDEGQHHDRRRRGRQGGHRGPHPADPHRDRVDGLRLGPREAAGAARPSSPAASRCCASAPRPRSSSRRRSTVSRTPSPRPGPRSRKASSPAAAARSCTSRASLTTSASTGDEATGVGRRAQGAVRAGPLDRDRTRARRAPSWWRRIATLPAGHGYNAATGEYGDLMAQGVLDPVKVTRSAVQNAASIAGMLLTTETLIVEKPEEDQPNGDGHGHSHGHAH